MFLQIPVYLSNYEMLEWQGKDLWQDKDVELFKLDSGHQGQPKIAKMVNIKSGHSMRQIQASCEGVQCKA